MSQDNDINYSQKYIDETTEKIRIALSKNSAVFSSYAEKLNSCNLSIKVAEKKIKKEFGNVEKCYQIPGTDTDCCLLFKKGKIKIVSRGIEKNILETSVPMRFYAHRYIPHLIESLYDDLDEKFSWVNKY